MRTVGKIILMMVLAAFAFPSKAQTGAFLNIPQNARELAMGGVNAGSDAETVFVDDKIMADISYKMWSPK